MRGIYKGENETIKMFRDLFFLSVRYSAVMRQMLSKH